MLTTIVQVPQLKGLCDFSCMVRDESTLLKGSR